MKIAMKKADALWRELVRERDDYRCQRCMKYYPEGHRQGLDTHHIFSRSKQSTRHMLLNGITLCTYHHIRWAHAEPLEFHEWVRERLSPEAYDELRRMSNMSKKDLAKEVTSQA